MKHVHRNHRNTIDFAKFIKIAILLIIAYFLMQFLKSSGLLWAFSIFAGSGLFFGYWIIISLVCLWILLK